MEPRFESFLIRTSSSAAPVQTGVECKLPVEAPEIARVLSATARVFSVGIEPLSGEVNYAGRVLFSVVYVDREGNVKKCECGVEYRGAAKDACITPQSELQCEVRVENVRFRTAGDVLYLTAVVTTEFTGFTPAECRSLAGCAGLVAKTDEVTFLSAAEGVKSSLELVETWEETGAIADVLTYFADVAVLSADAGVGSISVEGSLYLTLLCRGTGGNLYPVGKTLPFRVEVEENECMPGHKVETSAAVGKMRFDVLSDPEKNTGKITLTYDLLLSGRLYREKTVTLLTDGFSEEKEILFERGSATLQPPAVCEVEAVRISAKAPLGEKIAPDGRVLAALLQGVYSASAEAGEGFVTAEGVLSVSVYYAEGGAVKAVTADVPFSATVKNAAFSSGGTPRVRFTAERVSADFTGESEVSVTATLRAEVCLSQAEILPYCVGVSEGAPRQKRAGAVSICFPQKGDTLWELSKALGVSPEGIVKNNPDLTFPLSGEERVVLYRRRGQ